MAPRPALAQGGLVRGWLASMLAGLSGLGRLRPWRQPLDSPELLGRAALKDIGLSPGDLPAVRAGQYFSDATRIQR